MPRCARCRLPPPYPSGYVKPTDLPTSTPHPSGYVKPTDLPTFTPFPTVVWPTVVAEPRLAGAASEQTTSTAILEEVRDFAQKEVNQNYSIARVRVGSAYRDVTQASPPITIRRQTLEILTTYRGTLYRGTLPDSIEVLASLTGVPQSVLPVGDEFIAFVEKRWVLAEEDDNNPYGEGRKFGELSQQELDALGGEAYSKSFFQLWIIDGPQAHQVPIAYMANPENPGNLTHLEAARAVGKSVLLADLEATLRSLPVARPATSAASMPAPTPLPEQALADLAGSADKYDAASHVRVLSHTDYTIQIKGIDWPDELHLQPAFSQWRRSQMQVVETYHGALPDTFTVINDFHAISPNQSLDTGREYVLFLVKKWLPLEEHPGDERRVHYTPEQLEAVGGEGYAYFITQAWIVDGDDALLVPYEHITYDGADEVGDHLAGARRGGVTLSLTRLKSLITIAASGQ